jgi:hypothetical protein
LQDRLRVADDRLSEEREGGGEQEEGGPREESGHGSLRYRGALWILPRMYGKSLIERAGGPCEGRCLVELAFR